MSKHLFQAVDRNSPGPKHNRAVTREVNDRRFHSNATRATVENNIDIVTEISNHMGRSSWAHASEAIRRWRSDSATKCSKKFQRHRMIRNTNTYRRAASSHYW
jgi:hypothetical protein